MFEGGGSSGESEGDPTVFRSIPASSVRVEGKGDETGSSWPKSDFCILEYQLGASQREESTDGRGG